MLITFGIKILHNFDLTNTERKNRRKEGFYQLSVKIRGFRGIKSVLIKC